ncbi:glycosyltransferase family 1 protein [Annulohypoxylon truncatum]|uniref:glycosyltransferase family 1 protein n=1 Tax=Annulohypoxylon truncatum TaxID=327061 RepID=UPI002008DEAE|nr:glycosyltransferase family 1 protein [Annulohypoxylon truncatum]KAI1207504.1 glycosyltransferase family 1 protein [Annulohypoxylon truncatum]
MAPPSEESNAHRRVSKKLQKRRKEEHQPTMELPDRLKDHGDDVDEDVLPPTQGPQMFMNMNQSIFGLIAAAGSSVDFNDRFEGQSSDEDEDTDQVDRLRKGKEREQLAQTVVLKKGSSEREKGEKQRRRISGHLLRSLPQLPRLATRSRFKQSKSSGAQPSDPNADGQSSPTVDPLSPTIDAAEAEQEGGRLAPVMSRMLEARVEMSSRQSFDLERLSGDHRRADADDAGPSLLARKLKQIFEFDEPEEVIEEYPCWLLQSVLLQGYMYITAKHICFYAYLPKKAHEVAKSGYLSKSGKRNPKYSRYWFRLKGDVLAYYKDPSNLYFPHGQIDLSYAISASVDEKEKDGLSFSVVTNHRTYHLRADSAPSAKEWVKSLQRVIFRSHNDGDSVKISLPIENVIDVEDSQMIEFADTCKIRVIDNDETYAIDEYFFSFFSFSKEAINVLKILVDNASKKDSSVAESSPSRKSAQEAQPRNSSVSIKRAKGLPPLDIRSPKIRENVRATLVPMSPHSPRELSPRASGDVPRGSFDAFRQLGRRSLDLDALTRDASPRRSFSASRSLSKHRRHDNATQQDKMESSDSYVHSIEDPSTSAMASSSNEDPSGSQILRGSEVFHRPTIRRSISVSRTSPRDRSSGTSRLRETSDESLPYVKHHAATTGHVNDLGADEKLDQASSTSPGLQKIANMGAYPLQRAGLFANYLNKTSRHMSNLLATESMGYVEKVSGMWKGGRKHYHETPALKPEDGELDDDDGVDMDRFRAHFALPETEKLQATYYGYIVRVLPLYGKVYISDRHFCFRSLLLGTRTKLILPLKDIETAEKEKGFRFGYSGLVVVIRGHEELFFEFNKAEIRDDCTVTLLRNLETTRYLREIGKLDQEDQEDVDEAMAERDALHEARLQDNNEHELKMPHETSCLNDSSPTILFDDPKASFLNFKPSEPMSVTCLTIGSRGDVQPYIALCKGLMAEGHKVRIATHAEFKNWIEGHGIEFSPVSGDPSELMRICIQNGTFTWAFLKEANSKFRGWLDDLLASAYEACKDSDLLIESPSAMAGIHIAEALGIPYFRAFTMPWTRTRAYPHAFVMPEHKMGGAYNYVTYVMFDNVFWKATAHQINRWRNNILNLPNTNLEKLQPNKVPFLYNFSPAVVAPPLDYSDWIRVTGYWFLDEGTEWTPPDDLMNFIQQARKDEKKLVYVGFGSIIVPDPAKMTQEVIDAVLKADVRCVLSKGWSDRIGNKDAATPEQEFPPEIFQIKSAPHDWLFAQMDAAAHHGGSGTTGASLRAGIPTIIRPFFGDQFFFGSRVEDLGVGICLKKWGANSFARALWETTHSERMIVKARVLGETIRRENGVDTAIQCIYRDLEYAKSLIKSKAGKNAATASSPDGTTVDDSEEESWTFVGGDEGDPELVVKKSALSQMEANMAGAPGVMSMGTKLTGGKGTSVSTASTTTGS